MNLRSLCLAAVLAPAAGGPALAAPPPPAFVIAASDGIDFDDSRLKRVESSRSGHADYTAQEYQTALAALPSDQRIAVRSIMNKLASGVRPQLEALVAKHRVQYKDATGHTLVDNLWALVDKPLRYKLRNADLLKEIVRDTARPTTITQGEHNTCTATSVQAALARSAPGEYARIIAGLASGDGVVTARDGKLKLSSKDYVAFKDRTITGNLFQPAVMEVEAQFNDGHYDNRTDTSKDRKGETWQGAMDADVSRVQTALLVGKYKTLYAAKAARSEVVRILRGASPKEPVLVGFWTAGGGGHEVQVVGFDPKQNKYAIRNPWGELLFLPPKDVETHADGVNYRVR